MTFVAAPLLRRRGLARRVKRDGTRRSASRALSTSSHFEPQHEEFKARTLWSLSNAFFQKLGSHPGVQCHGEAWAVHRAVSPDQPPGPLADRSYTPFFAYSRSSRRSLSARTRVRSTFLARSKAALACSPRTFFA